VPLDAASGKDRRLMKLKRILVVDDEVTLTRQLKLGLEATGLYEVREENRGARALTAVQVFRPHLVILDVCMPDKDGGQIAADLRAKPGWAEIPIIFLTSLVSESEDGEVRPANRNWKFAAKPVHLMRLMSQIEDSCDAALTVS